MRSRALRVAAWVAAVVAPMVVLAVLAPRLFDQGAPALSDHAYRFTQLVWAREAIRAGSNPLGWSPRVWGGYPDLQFYQPGFAFLGAGIGSLFRLDDETAYRWLTIVVYLLPAASGALCLLVLRARPVVAALGGFVAGYVAFGVSGTISGTGYGTVASRLSLGLAPLAVAALVVFARRPAERRVLWAMIATVLVAAVVLSHPYHFAPTALVALAVTYDGSRRDPWLRVGVLLAAGFAFAGVWWVGQALQPNLAAPFLWANLEWENLAKPIFARPWDWWILVGAAVVGFGVSFTRRRDEPFVLYRSLPLLVALIAFVKLVVVDTAGVHLLDPLRLADDLFFWVALASVLVLEALARMLENVRWARVAIGVAVVPLAIGWVLVERPLVQPDVLYGLRLSSLGQYEVRELADDLRDGQGRVLFVNSTAFGGSVHLGAYIAYLAQREYVGGTSTHPSPLQPILLYGPGATEVRDLANYFDDTSLFGIRWEQATVDREARDRLMGYLRELGATQLVMELDGDGSSPPPVTFAEAHPELLALDASAGNFRVYRLVDPLPGRVAVAEGDANVVIAEDSTVRTRAQVSVLDRADVRIRYLQSPYWSVRVDGREVTPRADELRQMRIELGPGTHEVELTVRTPTAVKVGAVLALLVGLALLAAAVYLRWPGPLRRWCANGRPVPTRSDPSGEPPTTGDRPVPTASPGPDATVPTA